MAERVGQAAHEEEEDLQQEQNTLPDQHRETVTPGEFPHADSCEFQHCPSQRDEKCPGCQSLGILMLPCGHTLCRTCITLSQEELGQAGCTICHGSQLMDTVLHTLLETLFRGQPRRTGVTSGAVEASVRVAEDGKTAKGGNVEEEELCVKHGELLSMFCLEEEEPVCLQCQTDEHEEHQSCCIQEAATERKRELQSAIRNLQEQLENLSSIRQALEDTAVHIKRQSVQTAQFLRVEFERMHQYLRDEEASVMSQLKQEEEEKSERITEKFDRINNDIEALTDSIRETEEAMASDDIIFLKNYKKASDRAQCRVEEPEDEPGALLDVAKHQSCVQHQVWDKMLRIIQYFPVTMDPNTGAAGLGVSPDLSSVFVCEEQPLPNNSERFVSSQSILGSEAFSSGKHSWEVEVGDNSHWSLGVASESIHKKDRSKSDLNSSPGLVSDIDPGSGLWTVSLSSGEFWAYPGVSTPLKLRRKPTRVRIQLDWERGCLTISDAYDNTLVHRFKKQWSGSLRPYFSTTCSKHPLTITAGRVTVSIE